MPPTFCSPAGQAPASSGKITAPPSTTELTQTSLALHDTPPQARVPPSGAPPSTNVSPQAPALQTGTGVGPAKMPHSTLHTEPLSCAAISASYFAWSDALMEAFGSVQHPGVPM